MGKLRHGEAACTFSDAPPETSIVPGSSARPSASHPRELHFLSSEPSSPGCLQGSAHLPLTSHSLFYSVPGRFADPACSCPARPPLPHTMTLCISPGPSPPSLRPVCLLSVQEPRGAAATGQGTPGLGSKVCPPGAGREKEAEAGLSPPITFLSG